MFSLAKELGKTVGELEQTLTMGEIVEWQAFFSLQQKEEAKGQLAADAQRNQQSAAKRF